MLINSLKSNARNVMRIAGDWRSRMWQPYSKLFLAADGNNWVLKWEMKELKDIAKRLNIPTPHPRWTRGVRNQCVFYSDQFFIMGDDIFGRKNNLAFAYFHGRPSKVEPQFAKLYERFKSKRDEISRVQASNSIFRDFLLESGIGEEKVHVIPIGINLSYFRPVTSESRKSIREEMGIPLSAVVVGSFQKDGVGWDDGSEPKLIKGPDVLVKALGELKKRVPELAVVLTGPARGYVKRGLTELKIPYFHRNVENYPEVGRIFHSLDFYMISAREEGGPKAILEAMASGIPLVTTRVGQAVDLVQHQQNGYMVDVEDFEGLAHWAHRIVESPSASAALSNAGRKTAEANSYEAQDPLWQRFFEGLIKA